MRVTRAALRAQVFEDQDHDSSLRVQSQSPARSSCMTKEQGLGLRKYETISIHEDAASNDERHGSNNSPNRRESADVDTEVLKDITVTVNTSTTLDSGEPKPMAFKKRKAGKGKKKEAEVVVFEREIVSETASEDMLDNQLKQESDTKDDTSQGLIEFVPTEYEDKTVPFVEEVYAVEKTELKAVNAQQEDNDHNLPVEELEVELELSDTNQKPSEHVEPAAKDAGNTSQRNRSASPSKTPAKSPLLGRSPESEKFEASFDAMDTLEDEIEELTADLPQVQDSPVKRRVTILSPKKTSTPSSKTSKTPITRQSTPFRPRASIASKTTEVSSSTKSVNFPKSGPVSALAIVATEGDKSDELVASMKKSDKTGTPMPLTPVSVRIARFEQASSQKPELSKGTPDTKTTSTKSFKHHRTASTPLPIKPTTAAPRQSSAPFPRPSLASRTHLRQSSQAQNSSTNPSSKSTLAHRRRMTSTNLSTNSQPFIPVKSSKPPTTSTFALPGEAIAAKLKAQKEAREERKQQGLPLDDTEKATVAAPKMVVTKSSKPPTTSTFKLPGEEVAAKLKAAKEAREERRAQGVSVEEEIAVPLAPAIKSSKPPTVSTFQLSSEAIAAKLKVQKEEREARRAAGQVEQTKAPISTTMTVKSKKPPTTSTFSLSSEETAARLKAMREEREDRRRQQDEKEKQEADKLKQQKKTVHHARALSTSKGPSIVPRENRASKIRIASGTSINGRDQKEKENTAPVQH